MCRRGFELQLLLKLKLASAIKEAANKLFFYLNNELIGRASVPYSHCPFSRAHGPTAPFHCLEY